MPGKPGDRLRDARKRKDLSQQEVADSLHLSVETYKSWEQSRSEPRSLKTAGRLCDQLGITLDYYVRGCQSNVYPDFDALDQECQHYVQGIVRRLAGTR